MNDLREDVESLPGLRANGSAAPERAEPSAIAAKATPADMPDELAGLISSWRDLPANVRSAIAALTAP